MRVMHNINVSLGDQVLLEGESTKYNIVDFGKTNLGIESSIVFFMSKNK